ncbi:globin domain-containing protein [Streptacidiphilus cavernicola]|uniref:nitric oxide dioxygenase n=1 Tax=Streptacidiphilus cavernicola TaxID=3342716 RepID=A0ABV6VWQ3_9ACTN
MLSSRSADTVEASLPVVGAAIGEISQVFYRRLFEAHPDLLDDLFNRGNQANGSQQQALAGSIAAFAGALLAHPDQRPDALLARIAHKHVSLGITEDQYPVVHTHLFAAIAEVLGEAVTPEVAAAWDEVYWLMANALTALERGLYAQSGRAAGDVWRTYRVVARYQETDDVVTFLVHPADGRPVPEGQPGQYVSVQVELPDGARQIRQYSLSGHPDGALQFSVKRELGNPLGEVSHHLHENVGVGRELQISAPSGDVVLDRDDAPLLLASAGIGCTPMISMLACLADQGSARKVIAVHGDRDQTSHPFRSELGRLAEKLRDAETHVWYERPLGDWPTERTGLVDLTGPGAPAIPEGTRAYLCGPLPFLRSVRTQLLDSGVRAADIHYEVFGPDLWLQRAG